MKWHVFFLLLFVSLQFHLIAVNEQWEWWECGTQKVHLLNWFLISHHSRGNFVTSKMKQHALTAKCKTTEPMFDHTQEKNALIWREIRLIVTLVRLLWSATTISIPESVFCSNVIFFFQEFRISAVELLDDNSEIFYFSVGLSMNTALPWSRASTGTQTNTSHINRFSLQWKW